MACSIILGCGQLGGEDSSPTYVDSSLPTGGLSFEVSPVATSEFSYILALGNMNPPAHTFPTDHIYFVHNDYTETIPVVAPAAGKVIYIYILILMTHPRAQNMIIL